ncbi:unnamed protein product [Leptosia nina]|uniref:Sulfatase N-terminal domain-containing protein n=1 Tax=Leptosia nina TaxID=320188 RepID=A0AAV1JAV2_9NEOP
MVNGLSFWQKWGMLMTIASVSTTTSDVQPPHIVFIMADDLGFNDVSYHGSDQISTPNIDTLASSGIVLKQYYSEAVCTPARTALLTGKYPMRLGMQGVPLYNSEDRGIPLTEKLLPAYLSDVGYKPHIVGKWHVGMSQKEYLPTNRGFISHYGMRGGFVDSYTYQLSETWPDGTLLFGLDLFDNDIPQLKEDRYILDALTDRAVEIIHGHNSSSPLFLHFTSNAPHAGNAGGALQPPLYKKLGSTHIANTNRRLYAEIVKHFDSSVGKLVSALSQKGMLENTLIVFVSDNGAPTTGMYNNWGVNLPLRGIKQSPWEGGVRVPAVIWHTSFKPRTWDGLMHVTDWLPTLIAAAGGHINEKLDGVNQWPSITQGQQSPRREVLIAIDDKNNPYAAIRVGDYKLVIGNLNASANDYYGAEFMPNKETPPDYYKSLISSETANEFEKLGITFDYGDVMATRKASVVKQTDTVRDKQPCVPTLIRGCLYNVKKDPQESHDLWPRGQKIAANMMARLRVLWSQLRRRGPTALSIEADPSNYNYVWLPWVKNSSELNSGTEYQNTGNYMFRNDLRFPVVVGCECTYGFQNILCVLRSMFK